MRPNRKVATGGFVDLADDVASWEAGRWAVGVVAIRKKRKETKRFNRIHVDPRSCGVAALLQPAAWPAVKRASGW